MGSGGSKKKSPKANNHFDITKLSCPILIEKLPKRVTSEMIQTEFPASTHIVFPPTTQDLKKALVYFRTNEEAVQAYHNSTLLKGDLFRLYWMQSRPSTRPSTKVTASYSENPTSDRETPSKQPSALPLELPLEAPTAQPSPEEIFLNRTNGNCVSRSFKSFKSAESLKIKAQQSEPVSLIKAAVAMSSLLFKPSEIMISNIPEDTASIVTQLKRIVILYTKDVEVSPDATFIIIRFKHEDDTKEMAEALESVNLLRIQRYQFSWNDSKEAALGNLDPFQRFGDFGCGMGHTSGSCQTNFQLEITYLPDTATKVTLLEDFPSAYQIKINAISTGNIGILKFGPMGITEWNFNRAKKIFKGHRAMIRLLKIQKFPAPLEIVNVPDYFTHELFKQEFPNATRVELRPNPNQFGKKARIQFNSEKETQRAYETSKRIRFYQSTPKFLYNKEKKLIYRHIQAQYQSK